MHLKRALITGASSGLGEEFARQLARREVNLILTARRKDLLENLAAELTSTFGIGVEIVVADLTDTKDVSKVVKAIETHPDLDLLINNAGFGVPGHYYDKDFQRELDMLNVHVMAVNHLTRAALQNMVPKRHGAIINVSSVAGFGPTFSSSNYCATKAYLIRFSEGLALELKPHNVAVQVLCPGYTHTGFHSTPEYVNRFNKSSIPKFAWLSSRFVVARSLQALDRGKVVVVPGWGYSFLAWFAGTALYRILLRLVYHTIMKAKHRRVD